jgi:hypothetical protein
MPRPDGVTFGRGVGAGVGLMTIGTRLAAVRSGPGTSADAVKTEAAMRLDAAVATMMVRILFMLASYTLVVPQAFGSQRVIPSPSRDRRPR